MLFDILLALLSKHFMTWTSLPSGPLSTDYDHLKYRVNQVHLPGR